MSSNLDTCLQNNFDQCLPSIACHSAILYRKSVIIWYPGRAIVKLLRYQISSTSCRKWWN